MIYYIYKITCLCGRLKNHYYIGKHSTDNMDDCYYGSGRIIKHYYEKYPPKEGVTIIKEILEFNNSQEENDLREYEIIGNLYDTDDMCLNMKAGGGSGTPSEELRKQISNSLMGHTPWNKGKTNIYSDETRVKISNTLKGRKQSDEQRINAAKARIGHVVTEETRRKISEAQKGVIRPSRQINQYTIEGYFIRSWVSTGEILNELGWPKSAQTEISRCCRGGSNTARGYIWRYVKEEYNPNFEVGEHLFVNKRLNRQKTKPVAQISIDDNSIINIFKSADEAARQLDISRGNIQSCCKGRRKKAGGFKFSFFNDIKTKKAV